MKGRLCQIMNCAYDNLSRVKPGKRFRPDGPSGAGQRFECARDEISNRKTAGQGGDHQCNPNAGALLQWRGRHCYHVGWCVFDNIQTGAK